MYNLKSMLYSMLDIIDVKKFDKLKTIKNIASAMKSLTTSGAWKKTNKSGSRGGRMDSIPEEDARGSGEEAQGSEDENEDEDDLGVFDNDNIRAALNQMNCRVAYIAYGVCAPSITWPSGPTAILYSFHILLRL